MPCGNFGAQFAWVRAGGADRSEGSVRCDWGFGLGYVARAVGSRWVRSGW